MRRELERRPLVIACAALILGLSIARHPINLLLLGALPFAVHSLRGRTVAAIAFCLGVILSPAQPPPLILDPIHIDSNWSVTTQPKMAEYGQRCEIGNGNVRLMLTYLGPLKLCPGDLVHVRGEARPPSEGMDGYYALRELNGKITANAGDLEIVDRGSPVPRIASQWRDAFVEFVSRYLPHRNAVETAALTFNADGLLDETNYEQLRRTGTTHIIAASGMQVVVVAQAFFAVLMLLPVPRSVQLAIASFFLLLYVFAAGLNPPIVRAAIMWGFANYAYVVRREPDWFSALAASSIIYLLWRPTTIYDMGFQFSMAAVMFLTMFSDHSTPPDAWAAKIRFVVWQILRTAAIATVVVTPIIAYHFGEVSLVTIPANLLIVLVVGPVVIVAMTSWLISLFHATLAGLLLGLTAPFTNYIDWVLNSLGADWAVLRVPEFSAYCMMPFYLCLLALWKPHYREAA